MERWIGDLKDTARCQAVVDEAVAAFGGADVLVEVAGGAGPMGKTGWTSPSMAAARRFEPVALDVHVRARR